MSAPAWPITNRSRRPSVSSICCFRCPPRLRRGRPRDPKPEGATLARPAIDLDYLKARLADLLNPPSPTGYTDEAVWLLCRELERLGLEYELTRRGAIRARLPGRDAKPARAVVAHVDTLGAQVKQVKDNGRLALVAIGHWSSRFAEGARAT